MAFILVLRVAILTCIFLGVVFAIIATAGKEWVKYEIDGTSNKLTHGLWDYCARGQSSACLSINDVLKQFERAKLIERSTKGEDVFL